MKKMLLFFAMLMAVVSMLHAQTRQLSGSVRSTDDNPIPMVTIQIKGTTNGTVTDGKGRFNLQVPEGAVLVVRSLGYHTREIPVGTSSTLNITLTQDDKSLSEVVVTALGTKENKRKLGFAAQDIKAEDLTRTAPSNPLSALSGKVAGASVISASGTPGAAVRVTMRGPTTLGDNQPLFVVDGIPMDNSEVNTGSDAGGTAGVTQSNRLVDMNNDDIESITMLKGPAAAAIYGSRASNGVVVITTKKGKRTADGKTFNVAYGITGNFDKVNKLPDRQNKFAQGLEGTYMGPDDPSGFRSYSFGPAIDTMVFDGNTNYLWDKNGRLVGKSANPGGKKAIAYDPYDFFVVGKGLQHNLSVSGGNPSLGYRVSVSHLNQGGIIPNSNFKKTTVNFSTDYKFNEKFNMVTSMNYANSGGNRPQQGSNTSGIMLGLLRTTPTFDNSNGGLKFDDPAPYLLGDNSGRQRSYRGTGGYDNPYWTVNMNPYTGNVQRFYGNVTMNYKPFDWLTITERAGADYSTDNRKQIYSKYSATAVSGQYFEDQMTSYTINNDLFATLQKTAKKVTYGVMLGHNVYDYTYKYIHTQGDAFVSNDFQGITNTLSNSLGISNSRQRRVAFYGQANFSYDNYLFVEATGRYESSSTLPVENQWYFFPSANVGFVFTDALKMNSKVLNYGKIRAAYSMVGRALSPYFTTTYYGQTAPGDGWTNGITFPYNGLVGYSKGSVIGNDKLKAEKTSQVELGADLRFFGDRITLDYTFYKGTSKDLLNQVTVANSSGYGSIWLNSATMTNTGHEVTLGVTPVRTKDFNWNMTFNYSQNRNNVVKLADGLDRIDFNGFTGISTSVLVGKQYGTLYGTGYLKDAQGRLVINDEDGSPDKGLPILQDALQYLGDINPKWIGSFGNTFTYKGISLYLLFETRQKFSMWNGTWGAMTNFGVSANTLDRYTTKVFDGVKGHIDANTGELVTKGEKNDIPGLLDEYYYTGVGSGFLVNEPFVEDASWVRLRELSLSYRLDGKKLFKNKPYFQAVTVSAIGRNLWLHTKYKGVDPETSLFGTQEAQGFDYFNNPGTKTYGFSLRFEF